MKEAEVRRDLYDGFGESLTRALEFVIIPLLFAFLGYLLDTRLGTGPAFAIAFGLFGVAGCGVKTFYSYRYRMQQAEKDMPWNR